MASTLVALASNLRAMASTLVAMASNLRAMAFTLVAMGPQSKSDGLSLVAMATLVAMACFRYLLEARAGVKRVTVGPMPHVPETSQAGVEPGGATYI